MSNRRASHVTFGFDFQVNAAIVLMLENIKDMKSLRLEGNYEDIELLMDDGQYILAQAKSVVNASSDFRNVRSNIKKSLRTLSEGSYNKSIKQLIFITNSPNPFNDQESMSAFYGNAKRDYNTLPPSAKALVDEYLQNIDTPLDTNKLRVQILPFETDNNDEKYKVVKQAIDDFIGQLNINIYGIGKRLLQVWHNDIFINSTNANADISLTKKSIMWPIIVIATDIAQYDDDFMNEFDESLYDEIVHAYKDLIDSCCERYDFFAKVLKDYTMFEYAGNNSQKCVNFAKTKWTDYLSEFDIDGIDNDTKEGLAKIVLYSIVRRRITIDNIRKGVNL